ncbi:MAG: TetR/AcrR family transcriptional regulator [bacterium]|nr:TetR/AcrR family transcriptional regulator [bacterium]
MVSDTRAADTRDQILDAAEAMLAEHGYAGTSLRQLTARANVNLAAVNYHFGGKEGLAKAVLERRIGPINRERMARLDALERPDVAAVVRAFVEPPLRAAAPDTANPDDDSPGHRMCRMFGRILVEQPPFLRAFLATQFRTVARRFVEALTKSLRRQPSATTWWRLHFIVGAMAHTLQNASTVERMSEGLCNPSDVDALVDELVAFAAAGFAAKAPRRRRSGVTRR